MKRSKKLWVLIVFFTWAGLKSASMIHRAEVSTDYGLLSSIGLGVLFYVLAVPILLGEAAVAVFLFRRSAKAYFTGAAVILAECIYSLLVSAIAATHLNTARDLYVANREARGLSVRQGSQLDFMFSTPGIGITLLVNLAFWAVVFYYLRRIKPELTEQR